MYTYEHFNKDKLPQLRVLVTNMCNSKCIYCRPGGESALPLSLRELNANEFSKVVELLSHHGLSSVKISGGEPLLRTDILQIISSIKKIHNVKYLELITREPSVTQIIKDLADCGLDCINFSLDTLIKEKWIKINGRNDFDEFINAIKLVSNYDIHLKINSILLMETIEELQALVDFIYELGGGTLKLLDIIKDISQENRVKACNFKTIELREIIKYLESIRIDDEILKAPGGLGHPMHRYILKNKVDVVLKVQDAGAFYSNRCKECMYYPCNDALMALRLTANGMLQKCLLQYDDFLDMNDYILNNVNIDDKIKKILEVYQTAQFYRKEEIDFEKAEKNDAR